MMGRRPDLDTPQLVREDAISVQRIHFHEEAITSTKFTLALELFTALYLFTCLVLYPDLRNSDCVNRMDSALWTFMSCVLIPVILVRIMLALNFRNYEF
jgi:uncharacterized membrane protein YhdT